MSESAFYKIAVKTLRGDTFDMNSLKGKVVLVVNTASKCGYTPQLEGLQKLSDKFHSQGLVVLANPCNQFGGQEPGNADAIEKTCKANYGVKFDILEKTDVNGPNQSPLYNFLKAIKGPKDGMINSLTVVSWNFGKHLVTKEGVVFASYGSGATPASLEKDIIALLK